MSESKRVVIVGGVAGGASCAARARRLSEEAEIVLFERGEHVSFANCGMPYHIGGVIPDRSRLLVQTPAGLRSRYGLDVRTRQEVLAIDRWQRTVTVRDLASGREYQEPYDALVLSPGAGPIRPRIPGADAANVFTLRSLGDMDAIRQTVDGGSARRAVIVGGGYIGLEMAEALRERKLAVTLVELAKQVFIPADPEMAAPLHQQLRLHGVDLRLQTSVTAIEPGAGGLRVLLSSGESIETDMVILSVGVRPESKLAREAGLEIGPSGGLVVDEHMRTADASIYAIGDAAEVTHLVGGHKAFLPLAGPANRQGRIAADNIFGRDSVYRRSQGTAICKVFDTAIGMTGLSEKEARRLGLACEKVYVHPASHAGYYPGAAQISLKLLFDPQTGKVLGAQAVGAEGVDKRIDVLAVALRAGMTVEDLGDLELSYAPPYGSAKDPVNYAGFVAANARRGDGPICHVQDVVALRDDQLLLDVRTPAEVQAGTIPGARNIPIDELRERLGELPKEREILAFCQVGLRGYLACRLLAQHGYRARNLSGGYKTYTAATAVEVASSQSPVAGAKLPVPAPRAASCRPLTPNEMKEDTGEMSGQTKKTEGCCCGDATAVREIDARGLSCPGPIMKLKAEIEHVPVGCKVAVTAGDPAFPADVAGWCHSTGNRLVNIEPAGKAFRATIVRGDPQAAAAAATAATGAKGKTIVVFSNDFDKAMAAFIIANGAAAMGSKVTMFFTFWGLNVLRKKNKVKVRKNLIERMFGWMMPRGATRLGLSKMNMAGMGGAMIRGIMRKKNVATLPELIESARTAGVRLVACSMSMDLMGLRREELLDGIEEGGVATYLDTAEGGNVNLFI